MFVVDNKITNAFKRKIRRSFPYVEIMYKSILEQRQYKTDLYIRCIYEVVIAIVNLVFYDIIYLQSEGIAGWSLVQMKNLVLISSLIDGVITLLFSEGLSQIPKLISMGELDYLLIKPVNIRLYISLYKVSESQIYSCTLFFVYLVLINIKEGIYLQQFCMFLVSFCISVFILYCVFFIIMSLAFWTVKIDIGVTLFFQLFSFGNKPITIYPYFMKTILLFIIPVGMAINFPAYVLQEYINGRFILIQVIVAIYMYFLSRVILKKGLQQYTSTGN